MKKLAILVMASLLAVMFAAPSFAGDMLELSGEYRVRGWDKSNRTYVDSSADDQSYFDQRMRLQAKVKANDNAYVVIRGDIAEGTWGDGALDGSGDTIAKGGAIEIDRAFAVFSQEMWELTAGLQYYSLGISEVVDSQPVGLKLLIKTDAVQPSLMFAKISENGDKNDDDANDDANLYGLNVNFGGGGVDAKVFGAYMDENASGDTKYALGAYAAAAAGSLNLSGELAYLGGDDGQAVATDYIGTQFYFKADSNINEKVKLGGEFLFAFGSDDANESQISNVDSNWDSFAPIGMDTAPDTDLMVLGGDAFNIADTGAAKAADATVGSAGIIGLTLFVDAQVMEDLSLGAKGGYFMPEEDTVTDLDSLMALNLWGQYDLGSNTKFILAYLYATPDYDTFAGGEDASTIYAKFAVKF